MQPLKTLPRIYMKFTFPFFKKKRETPVDRAVDNSIEQPVAEASKSKVDWGSVRADDFVPHTAAVQSPDSEGMSSFEVADIPEPIAAPVSMAASVATPKDFSIAQVQQGETIPMPVKVVPQSNSSVPKVDLQGEVGVDSAPQPQTQQETQVEIQTPRMTKEDAIAAYKIFLNRPPESTAVINQRVGGTAEANLIQFMLADEFLKRPEISPVIMGLAKQIIERQKVATVPNNPTENGQNP